MSADKYYLFLSDDKATAKNSIFSLTMRTNNGENISGEIYYFNRSDDGEKKIQKLSEFNDKQNKIHIIVYNGRDLAYYKPPNDKIIDDPELVNKLNSYDKCIIINIEVGTYKNTYIFLREEQTKQNPDGIFEEMKKENKATFEKYNLINIVKALFNIIEDYYINIGSVPVAKEDEKQVMADAREIEGEGEMQTEERSGQEARKMQPIMKKMSPGQETAMRFIEERGEREKERETERVEREKREEEEKRRAEEERRVAVVKIQARARGNAERKSLAARQTSPDGAFSGATGGGKRKYKANVNQKSLKKMSTIIKKLLKINLNIKQATKPKAKQATKPKAKPATKPKAKPATKPKAKPATKPKAKPATKPKAKQATKPKAKPAAKPKAKQAAKPKAKQAAKPTAKPKAKPATKPKAKK